MALTATMQAEPSPKVVALEAQIQSLTELYNRVQTLRQIPPTLLKPPSPTGTSPNLLEAGFQQVKEIGDVIRSDPIQESLRAARDSVNADSSELNFNLRRENRKRRRPPSPESPQPYIALERKSTSLFPLSEEDGVPLKVDGLEDYIREFNREHKAQLHLWRKTHAQGTSNGRLKVLRFTIANVMTAYITLTYAERDGVLVAESLSTFAPRERKAPHSQSDYVVYQNLSQQLAKMVQSHPRVSVQSLVSVLCAYEGLFVERCSRCERVLSAEGHVPPVVRMWEDEGGGWLARHVGC